MRWQFSLDIGIQFMKQYLFAALALGGLICALLCVAIISIVCFAMLLITPIDALLMPLALAAFLAPFFIVMTLAPFALSSGLGVMLWAFFSDDASLNNMRHDMGTVVLIAQVISLPLLFPLLQQITGLFNLNLSVIFLPVLIVSVASAIRTDDWHDTMYRRRKPKFSVIE